MKNIGWVGRFGLLLGLLAFWGAGSFAVAENIDPDEVDAQYAWGENTGWLNAEPLGQGGPGVTVAATAVTGYAWGENIGWISFSCENTGTCEDVDYGVQNDGSGNLSGFAWGENVGWISFSCTNTDSCSSVDYGVAVDPSTGQFSGQAWGENIGWINFDAVSLFDFGIVTAWGAAGCLGDLDPDGDVDGKDLAVYAASYGSAGLIELSVFAGEFGTFCGP
jgi:hypothetical protein